MPPILNARARFLSRSHQQLRLRCPKLNYDQNKAGTRSYMADVRHSLISLIRHIKHDPAIPFVGVRGDLNNTTHIYQTPVDNTSVWGSLGVFVYRGCRWPPQLQQLSPSNFTANSHHPKRHTYPFTYLHIDTFKFGKSLKLHLQRRGRCVVPPWFTFTEF